MTELGLAGITNIQQVEKTAVTAGYQGETHLLISLRGNGRICQHSHTPYAATRSADLLLKCSSEFLLLNHLSAID